jgi:hypothetical protein
MDNTEVINKLQARIEELKKEGQLVAQDAANKASAPYLVAIKENETILAMLLGPTTKE